MEVVGQGHHNPAGRRPCLVVAIDADGTIGLLEFDRDRRIAAASVGSGIVGQISRGYARTLGPELELTLREIRGAARSIKRLADALERDPDMLLKGRAEKAAKFGIIFDREIVIVG